MTAITLDDILPLQDYELTRDAFRRDVIGVKKRRRIALGPFVTLVFESRQTVLFQIQEMLRIERIVRPEKVQEEIDVYRELLPGDGELSATLFIEVTQPEQVQPTLDRFVGLDEPGRLVLKIRDRVVPARFAPGQSREDRISAVHYIRFAVGGPETLSGGRIRLDLEHAGYRASAELPPETLEELRKDLSG